MPEEVLIVLSAFADLEMARRVARTLVEERLAACANLIPHIESIYRWQGKVESNAEVLVIFKTTRGRYEQFERRLSVLHSYQVPEIVALPLAAGYGTYLDWVLECCSEPCS